ncbi:MAG: sodium:proton antiporter [Verrucomicrobia bacterium]|nr:MAG: sodium:proton antiporter [Verrucomicrobiota bacterium]
MIWVLGLVAARPNWPITLPFVILLMAIALAPLIAQHHWERHYHKLCVALAGIVCLYHLFIVKQSARVVHAGIDYATFMVVVGSFFVVAGGIHLRVKSPSGAMRNTLFLFVGALLGNLIGTIGASMLLIRPWIAMNRSRVAPMHIAFFIFLVSNIGGALLPVGPPLFLGFLKGVPFGWTLQNCWRQWLITVAIVLAVFFVLDLVNLRARKRAIRESEITQWRCAGAQNFAFLFALLAALIAVRPGWREPLMALIALGSYFATPQRIREANNFTLAPLKEVGWLFLGIFGTMIPVLEFMERSAGKLGLDSDLTFFWASGFLSALLDNAPTYLAFFASALGLHGYDVNDSSHVVRFISENGRELIAISLGATFFGALTYIGNAPNLFVKTIAEHARVPTPSFVCYIWKFAMPILIPIFVVISILFFR